MSRSAFYPARVVCFFLLFCLVTCCLAAAQSQIPTPESVLGFPIGADFKLANYDQSLAYFQKLDAASSSLRLIRAGRTSEGRDWYFALVSSPENLARIDQLRGISQRLAHPADLTEEVARQLSREGKAFVHLDGGLHATEVAAAQHTIQLAYDLISSSDPRIHQILENVVVLLWPSVNPDGQNIVVDWYRQNLGTPYEVSPLPRLYQKYIGHDNNRDAYMLSMIESRVLVRTWREWEPQIIYIHHQTSPFPTRIWLPPFAEPIARHAPPLMSRTVNTIGMAIAQALESNGQEGATHMGTGFDAWYPGYIDYLPMLQNTAAFWTETGLYRYATPHFYTISDFPQNKRDLRAETLYSSPWKGGWWRLQDAVGYMLTASVAVLDYAAKYKDDLLFNRYQAGLQAIRKYEKEPPFAYFVPQDQHDPVAPVELLRRLAFNGLRIAQLTAPVSHDGIRYPAGTWVVPMSQEFAEVARELLDLQAYPDLREFPEGPLEQPYDAAGWTLPLQMGVRVIPAGSPLSPEVVRAMRPVQGKSVDWRSGEDSEPDSSKFDSVPGVGFDTSAVAAGIVPPEGAIRGAGPNLVVDPSQNNAFRAVNRALKAGQTVRFLKPEGASAGGQYVIEGLSGRNQERWADELALQASRAGESDGPAVRSRIGVYHPWQANMDEGWCRWLLEQYGFEFSEVTNTRLKAGGLEDSFDVILMADVRRPGAILDGYPKGLVPPRYHGGVGADGVRVLDRFVRAGGTLVCLNRSALFAIEHLALPVKDVVGSLDRQDFFVSGSILEVEVDPSHPVMAGMPGQAWVFVDRSPVFTTLEGFEGRILAKYQKAGSPLLSGYLQGAEHLLGLAAALDVHHGSGHVILVGFRPQWRGQPFATFRVMFNAVLFSGELAAGEHGDPGFWSAPKEE